jgi:hypothetical protein
VGDGDYEGAEIGRPGRRRLKHAGEIQSFVGVSDHVSKARCPDEPVGQRLIDHTGRLQSAKCVGVALGRPGAVRDARRDRQVNHHLRGLPEMQDDDVGGVRR